MYAYLCPTAYCIFWIFCFNQLKIHRLPWKENPNPFRVLQIICTSHIFFPQWRSFDGTEFCFEFYQNLRGRQPLPLVSPVPPPLPPPLDFAALLDWDWTGSSNVTYSYVGHYVCWALGYLLLTDPEIGRAAFASPLWAAFVKYRREIIKQFLCSYYY